MKNIFTFNSHSFVFISFRTNYEINFSPNYQKKLSSETMIIR